MQGSRAPGRELGDAAGRLNMASPAPGAAGDGGGGDGKPAPAMPPAASGGVSAVGGAAASNVTPSRLGCIGELREELACSVCLDLCVRPCTTPCGHSFCRSCLRQALRHSSRCPKCREELPPGYELKVNTALWNIAQLLFPRQAAEAPPPSPAPPARAGDGPAGAAGPSGAGALTRGQRRAGTAAAAAMGGWDAMAAPLDAARGRREGDTGRGRDVSRRGGGGAAPGSGSSSDADEDDRTGGGRRAAGAGGVPGGGGGGGWLDLAAAAEGARADLVRLQIEEELLGGALAQQAADADLEALLRTVFGGAGGAAWGDEEALQNRVDRMLGALRLVSTPPPAGAAAASRGHAIAWPPAPPLRAPASPAASPGGAADGAWHVHTGDSPVAVSGMEEFGAGEGGGGGVGEASWLRRSAEQ
ncbi:MAG: hypothetical protein J3K34DRAFT_518897 [Monoraphidium minutum]|nr:MAG: hypothetical protein J3K34DRAFT_518897 [Monoraphidium minutum]